MASESEGPPDEGGVEAQGYFLAIEDFFVRLRGAPLLLAPADWHVARRWYRQGVPLELVRRAIEELFARRRERGSRGRISSLRYCAPAVEAAWEERAELVAPGRRHTAVAFDTAGRLRRLAAALPPALAGTRDLRRRLAALAERAEPESTGLDPQVVEERLADLDRAVLEDALAALDGEERTALDAKAARSLAGLAGRLPADEIERARERLVHQLLRARLGLPMLSLFSLEAQAEAAAGEPGTDPDA